MVTRPNTDNDEIDSERDRHAGRRRLLRLGSAIAAVALIGTLTVMMLISRNNGPDRSVTAYCDRMTDISALSDALASGDGSQIKAATTQLRRAAAVAPVEIEPSMQVLVGYADGLATSVATAGHDQGAVDAALAEAVRAQQAQIPAVESAGQTVQQYAQATCSIDITRTTGSRSTTDATSP
jgi:hypothetical protein